jgi:hypothetical protein
LTMSKKNKRQTQTSALKTEPQNQTGLPKSKRNFVLALIGITLFLAFGFWFFRSVLNNKQKPRAVGIVTGCTKSPSFVSKLGFTNQAALSTSANRIKGLAVIEQGKQPYQHESWKIAGNLAPIQLDTDGDIFVAPAPMINVLDNPFTEQNTIHKVDSNTQEMKPFAKLPITATATEQNPYGILGLGYDCETSSLYASSVAGSTRTSEIGKIYQIDPKNGNVKSVLENIDAFGIGVFNSAKGKRLYYGLARNPEVWSIGLDENGGFLSDAKRETSLESAGTRGDDKVRKIRFTSQNEMNISGIEFNFNLIAPTEKQETVYRFKYDSAKDSWSVINNR